MPYIPTQSRRIDLENDPYQARNSGEVNFVFSSIILKVWNATPSYTTLNVLRSWINKPSLHADFENMFYQIPKGTSGLSHDDIRAALDNAWDEFYARVGRPYEDKAILRNGDLPGYKQALDKINEKEKANADKDKLPVASGNSTSSKTV